MNNITSLICKNCGAQLKHKSNNILACDYCCTEMLIEASESDFVVVAGTLEKYIGSSTTVLVPNIVATIGSNAFKGLTNLTTVILPASVVRIEDSAFEECINLQQIQLPETINYIGNSAFKNSGLITLTVNSNLINLGNEAFMGCSSLTKVTITGDIKKSGSKIFKQCSQLKDVKIDMHIFSGSLKPSNEAVKSGDKRPTFFDFFQGTAFYHELLLRQKNKSCLFCNGTIKNQKCTLCEETQYDAYKSGCYIATCVYESYDCPQVWTLRRFRDNTLAATWFGRLFIRAYYAISPTLVLWFGKTSWFKKLWKGMLDLMVDKLQSSGVADTPYEDKYW